MAITVDNSFLREADNTALAKYFLSLLEIEPQGSAVITKHVLVSIEEESIPPRILTIWLSVCTQPHAIIEALQSASVDARKLAVVHAGKWIRSERFTDLWIALGETTGILQLMAKSSIADVKALCLAFARAHNLAAKSLYQDRMNELLISLASDYFPDASFRNPDTRPIVKLYEPILLVCHPRVAYAWSKNPALSFVPLSNRVKKHLRAEELLEGRSYAPEDSSGRYDQRYPPLRDEWSLSNRRHGAYRKVTDPMLAAIQQLWNLQNGTDEWKQSPEQQNFEFSLAVPLIRRLWRKHCPKSLVLDVLDLILKHLARETVRLDLALAPKSLIAFVVRLWARDRLDEYEQRLTSLLKLVTVQYSTVDPIIPILELVDISLREELLRLSLLHYPKWRLDINDDSQLEKGDTIWPKELFLTLQPEHATRLLKRLTTLKTGRRFISWRSAGGTSILDLDQRDDVTLLFLAISNDPQYIRETAGTLLQKCQREAGKSRESHDRTFWAQRALAVAVASGDGTKYLEASDWARRFTRDPMTVKTLYNSAVIGSNESKDLICGIPAEVRKETCEEVLESIKLGNQVALFLAETARMAITEPSFQYFHWSHVRDIFSESVERRLERAIKFQRTFNMSDDAVFEGLWQGTMDTLLEIERLSNEKENKNLDWTRTEGPFGHASIDLEDVAEASSATIRFLDTYMRARDTLWTELRRQVCPAVVTIPPLFPRGLPIQSLFPLHGNRDKSWLFQTPYLLSRATDIVFCSSIVHQAIPSSKEIRTAIGGYIDSYETALMVYVYSKPKGPEREANVERAWEHFTGTLSRGHLNAWEAQEFWHSKFESLDLRPALKAEEYQNPKLPSLDDPATPTEWNPDPAHKIDTEDDSTVVVTALDCLLSQDDRPWCLQDCAFDVDDSQLRAPHDSHMFWTRQISGVTGSAMPPASRSAIVAAALLYVSESIADDANVLNKPFPTPSDARFPALFLDDEFLDRSDLNVDSACEALLSYISEVPSEPLRFIVESFETALADPEMKSKLSEMYALFSLTADSHMPWKFVDLHLRLILDRPDDSSWHRQLLTPRLLDNLSAAQAEQVISDIGRGISERLEAEKTVKVTTLKQFATMIAGSHHVNHTVSLQFLFGLLGKCSQIDIQAVIVQGLINIFKTSGERIKSAIIGSLQDNVVELAASIDNQRVIREEEWLKAELETKAPEPSTDASPIATALLDLSLSTDLSDADRRTIAHEVLWPMIRKSRSNMIRWLRIFLAQHEVVLPDALVNTVINRKIIERLMNDDTLLITKDLLAEYAAYLHTQYDHSRELVTVHTKLQRDDAASPSKAFEFWTSIWGPTGSVRNLAHPMVSRLLLAPWPLLSDDGISRDQVQGIILAAVEKLVMSRISETSSIIKYLQPLKFNSNRNAEAARLWEQYARPLLHRVISMVAALRTPAWQRNPVRQPAFLPDCLELELWLVDYPERKPHDGSTRETQAFVAQLSATIDGITTDVQPYHDRFQLVKSTVVELINSDYVRLHTAFALSSEVGWEDDTFTLADVLRVDLARSLIWPARSSMNDAQKADVREMVSIWEKCSNEAIRTIADAVRTPVYSLFD